MALPGARLDLRGRRRMASAIEAESSVGPVRKVYRGRDIEVSFDRDICIHVGECLRGERSVFKLDRRPWVLPDAGDADVVADVIELCPSGALQYRRLDGGAQEEMPAKARVTPIRNGPLLVRGRIEVMREDGTIETLPRATLCRCGFSEHMPFCDNRHIAEKFRSPGLPYKIHLSPVRLRDDEPISKAEDPRGENDGEEGVGAGPGLQEST
jgi:uncharacterized Fe-S cluster protein YjdI/CDGSH-type Zn-finger protein